MGKSKKDKKNKLIFVIPVLLILSVVIGFSLNRFLGNNGEEDKENEATIHVINQADPSFFVEIDPITVNLRPQGQQQRFLKLVVRLETSKKKDEQVIKNYMPRIRDQLHVFLRELRVEDIEGSSGTYRIREEILNRINAVAQPAIVKDVLFDELLVQ